MDIEDNDGWSFLLNARKRLGAMTTRHCVEPLITEDLAQDLNNRRLIVDDNNLVLLTHTAAPNKSIEHLARERLQNLQSHATRSLWRHRCMLRAFDVPRTLCCIYLKLPQKRNCVRQLWYHMTTVIHENFLAS